MSNREQIINSIQETLKQVKGMIETETIIGKKITTDEGHYVIPISKVIVGYIGGGGEYFDIKVKKHDAPFATGCGMGAYIKPIGFLVLNKNGTTKYVQVDEENNLDKIADYLLDFLEKMKDNKEANNEK